MQQHKGSGVSHSSRKQLDNPGCERHPMLRFIDNTPCSPLNLSHHILKASGCLPPSSLLDGNEYGICIVSTVGTIWENALEHNVTPATYCARLNIDFDRGLFRHARFNILFAHSCLVVWFSASCRRVLL